MNPLLSVENLRVAFPGEAGTVYPVDGVSFTLDRGETLALVGESGCGKSLTSLGLLRLVPPPGYISSGRVLLDGRDLVTLALGELRQVRGGRIGMVFQDPLASLNPVFTAGDQISETVRAHFRVTAGEARKRAVGLLGEVGVPDPEGRYDAYPHQLSGGLRQRVMIAIALAGEPDLLIADEPTTALDVTVQAQILDLLEHLRMSRGMAVLLVTHDLGVVAGRADRVAVMYAGQIVETAPTRALFRGAAHPYTRGLLAAVPRLEGSAEPARPIPGVVPAPGAWPSGCRFHPRCSLAEARCRTDPPPDVSLSGDHQARCWLAGQP
jgi:peptide/nickel transport system ATP-binding protein